MGGVRVIFNCSLNTITYLLSEQTSPGCSEGGSDGSIVPRSFFLWPDHLVLYSVFAFCFCLISARWLPQIQTSHPHAVMFKGKRQVLCFSSSLRRENISRTVSRHFLKSQPKKCILWPPSAAKKVGKERVCGFFILQLSGEGTD